jgi:alkanesulfonate monooxygenase
VCGLFGPPHARSPSSRAGLRERAPHAATRASGRTTLPRIQVALRPIIAPTEELAWQKAHRTAERIHARTSRRPAADLARHPLTAPENSGSQRLLAIAERGER